MLLDDEPVAPGRVGRVGEENHLQTFQHLLLGGFKAGTLGFAHPGSLKKCGAIVPHNRSSLSRSIPYRL